MSVIKSASVGVGDMYYIRHNSDNFTMIDCMLPPEEYWRRRIVDELRDQQRGKGISRFISTHPDQDHVQGLKYLDERLGIINFYCTRNAATKEQPTEDFLHYCSLRDSDKAFHIHKGCTRRWMNQSSEVRGTAGINILWPDTDNQHYKEALAAAESGDSPNNTSSIIQYSLAEGVTALWMGDLETEFMEKVEHAVQLPDVDLLFAPHHGRESGRVPQSWLEQMDPTVIVLGEAPSEHLHYYPGWTTITQNRAGDITFDCRAGRVDVYVSSETYTNDGLYNANGAAPLGRYVGSFDV